MNLLQTMESLAKRSRKASRDLYTASTEDKNKALITAARLILLHKNKILVANAIDVRAGKKEGLSSAMLDRLVLNDKRINDMARGLKDVAAQKDPAWHIESEHTRPDGLIIRKVRVPLGSILFIYESRPNVTIDAAGLCIKAGNTVILRGGKEAFHSNRILVEIFREALKKTGLPIDAVLRVATIDRKALPILLNQKENIDLVIPRGGEGLIRMVAENSSIPVLKHYKGVCHVYIDKFADPTMALNIAINSKVQRPSVCNAMETLLIDRALNKKVATSVLKALQAKGVRLIGCAETMKIVTGVTRTELSDYYSEYLNLTLSVRVVDGVEGAIEHITKYGSGHTDAIVTRNRKHAELFMAKVDSSSVMWNASTRLADGGEYGLGAEIGISTDKLHARGPMGADDLTTYKWVVVGKGQLR